MKYKWFMYILNTKSIQILKDWLEYKQKQKNLKKYNIYIEEYYTAMQHALIDTKKKCIHIPDPKQAPQYCENFYKNKCSYKSCPRAGQHNLYKATLNKRNKIQQDVLTHWQKKLDNVK